MGLPLGSTGLKSTSAMVNLIGAEGENGRAIIKNIDEILNIPGAYLHWYAKEETRPGRKMGHVTFLNPNIVKLKEDIDRVNKTVSVIAKE